MNVLIPSAVDEWGPRCLEHAPLQRRGRTVAIPLQPLWTCYDCNIEILPILLLENAQDKRKTLIIDVPYSHDRKREQCATCHKRGNSVYLVTCDMCNLTMVLYNGPVWNDYDRNNSCASIQRL